MRAVRMTLLSAVLVFFGFAPAMAQNTGTVAGEITDANTGEPIPAVQVEIAGTNIGGLTGENGRYVLTNVPAGQQTVRATFIGYSRATATIAVPAGGTVTANFVMETSAIQLEGLVVSAATGREQRQRELGTNVESIRLEEVNQGPITSLADALSGRSSGVMMQDVGGTTGTAQRIRIRGANSLNLSNEPLIFIDGIQANNSTGGPAVGGQETSRLNDLNPNDIANIEVVKGPAASAMYGTAGANGVILITTKRGRPGATQWSVFVEQGQMEDITDYPTNWGAIHLFDQSTTDPFVNEIENIGGFRYAAGELDPRLGAFCPNYLAALGNCRQDQVVEYNTLMEDPTRPYDAGDRARYGASVRGGSEQVRYYISGQYEEEQGVISFNQLEKLNIRANLDAALSETADVTVSVGYTDSGLSLNNNDNSIFSPLINGLMGYPNYIGPDPARGVGGAPVNNWNYGFGFNMNQLEFLPSNQDVDRYIGSSSLRWRPTNWLTVNTQGGIDLVSRHDYETLQPGDLPIARTYALGYRFSQRSTEYLLTGVLSGVGTFELTPDLVSTTTVGTQYTYDNAENTYCYGSSLVPGTASCGTTASDQSVDEDFYEVRTIGGYVQQELGWRDRLFLAAGLRADDTSAFGSEFDLAYYPSASLSWVVVEEPWFPQTDVLSTLRLRTAYGVSGLRPGFRQAATLYSPSQVASATGDVPGASLSVTGNPQLSPERSREYEFGFDAGFFNDRLSAQFTYFNKESEDALISRPLAGSLGVTGSVLANLGAIRNTGTELTLNMNVYQGEMFGIDLGFTNSTLENEILDLGEGIEPITFNRGLQRHDEGYSAGGFFSLAYEWEDANEDGFVGIDEVDFVYDEDGNPVEEYIGPMLPTWQRSIFVDVRVSDFLSFSTLIEGRGGNYQGNQTESFRCTANFNAGYGCAAHANPDAPLWDQARLMAYAVLGTEHGYVEEADFYRWREASVTLSPPSGLTNRFQQLDGLSLTVAGRNLATWTDYSGIDPEANETGATNFTQSEFNSQPPVRMLTFRIDYSF